MIINDKWQSLGRGVSRQLRGGTYSAAFTKIQPLLLPCSQNLPRIQENLDTGTCMSYLSVFKYWQLQHARLWVSTPAVKRDISVVWIWLMTTRL